MRVNEVFGLLKTAGQRWWEHNTFRLGAALAYYTVFSLAPVVVIAVAVAGLVFNEQAARRQIGEEIGQLAGPQVARAVEATSRSAQQDGSGALAAALSVVILIVGATTVFTELQDDLNTIWGVQPKEGRGLLEVVKDRFWSFTMVLVIGLLLLVSLVVSAALSALSHFLHPGGATFWHVLNTVVSLGLATLLFAMLYKVLPDAEIRWGDVWVGAGFTALLFTLGKYLIGLYLGQSGIVSAYGAAGSLVVILLWVYYSSQILLLGAEFTYVYAQRSGTPLVPGENAKPATEEAKARAGASAPAGVGAAEGPAPGS